MGGRQSSALAEKKVVCVGGGFSAAHLVLELRGKCKLTVIDPREFIHYSIGSPRVAVEPGFEKKILVSHQGAWGECFKQGLVTSVDPAKKVVVLEGGEEVPYDIVVIATGSTVPFPGKLGLDVTTIAEASQAYKKWQGQVKEAKRITIIGGGAVGLEIAAEIRTDFPDKEVTVVESREAILLGPYKEKFKRKGKAQLEALGVKLVLGQKVANLADLPTDGSQTCTVKTDKGTEIEADLVIVSIGLTVNADAYKQTFAEKLDERSCLRVNEFLQVEGHDDVFAAGDCNNADMVKLAAHAQFQVEVLVKNIYALVDGSKMKPYKEETMMSLALGRRGGVTQFKSMVLGSFLTTKLKSGDMFVGKFWKDTMRVPEPKN